LTVVLYGCETWYVTLRGILGPEREEELHNEELHNIHFLHNIVRKINSKRTKWAGNAARMGTMAKTHRNSLRNLRDLKYRCG
jgi:hypothetical protein